MDTGESYETATNETGTYTIPFIKPGTFELKVSTPGFKQYTRAGIRLDTASAVRADAVLELGEVTETSHCRSRHPAAEDREFLGRWRNQEQLDS